MVEPSGTRHRAVGLTDDEFAQIRQVLDREPTDVELALYGVMWSEHCSYKSSRLHLRRLPTEGPRVLVGPGENAGVIDAGDGIAVAIRIESHNHPSAIEPYQGAATGVGGILRDIFTMGARPLAVLDPLFFGPLESPRARWLFEGVVSGISGYGNSVGVPTVGGELTFAPGYAENPLVNVLCLGALPVARLVKGAASGPGNRVVLLGATTGRDGIGGVSLLASAGFDSDDGGPDDEKRPSVQVGDPYEEKRLIEACLELLDRKLVVGLQDLGGAGLACATSETAARGGVSMDVDVSAVPLREPQMSPAEIMTSESQERMLAVVTPEAFDEVAAVCERWEVRATVVGAVRAADPDPAGGGSVGWLTVRDRPGGSVLAHVPAASLANDAPLYDRPLAPPADRADRAEREPTAVGTDTDLTEELLDTLVDPTWVHRQYDSRLFLNTVVGPGRDAALLRLAGPGLPPSERGLGVTTDSNPAWCALDPRAGTAWTLAEAVANVACVGATAVAVVNCLNFGNPEHEQVMWQLSECVDGLADGCRQLGLPVIGGNVSLYNESGGQDIDPTPVIGVLGLVESLVAPPPGWGFDDGDAVVLIGDARAGGDRPFPLGGSAWAVRRELDGGRLAPVDLAAFKRTAAFVTAEVARKCAAQPTDLVGVHDVAAGGLVTALAEMVVAADRGLLVDRDFQIDELLFETPGRFLLATRDAPALMRRAAAAGVAAEVLGVAEGDDFAIRPYVEASPAALRIQRENALPVTLAAVI